MHLMGNAEAAISCLIFLERMVSSNFIQDCIFHNAIPCADMLCALLFFDVFWMDIYAAV